MPCLPADAAPEALRFPEELGVSNAAFGWLLVAIGMASGACLGLRFQDERWLGGYASYPRRMLRLAHIACIALGALNVLFELSVAALAPSIWLPWASGALMLGALLMPASCLLSVHPFPGRPWIFLPAVLSLVAGAVLSGVILAD